MSVQINMTSEKFHELITDDKMLFRIATASLYYRHNGDTSLCYSVASYPTTYIATKEQVEEAKHLVKIRHDEIISQIGINELVFTPMGMSYEHPNEDNVRNYRIRCKFRNLKDENYFVEFNFCENSGVWCTENICLDIERGKRGYYNAKKLENILLAREFTFSRILELINRQFGCCYKSARLLSSRIVFYDEYVCKCAK